MQTPEGNPPWDCISLIDEPMIAAVNALGGTVLVSLNGMRMLKYNPD